MYLISYSISKSYSKRRTIKSFLSPFLYVDAHKILYSVIWRAGWVERRDEQEAHPDNMANVYFGSFWFTRLGIYTDISFAPERIRFYQSVQLSVKIESIFFLFFRPLRRLHAPRRKSTR